jgi:hypothetical protein
VIQIHGPHFKDEHGRTLLLRGVNLGGSSKVPAHPNGATHLAEGFFDHRTVSFVDRPFPLAEADEHFGRLRAWGLTFLRLLVPWEAVEHAGPGRYDRDYLDYLYALVRKAGEHGLALFVDPHQDVWSRFTGGDGAPGWTLEAVGLDMTGFAATGAALVHQTHGAPFPRMIWPTNGTKLAAATMFTLFFGGNDFAPQARIDGEPAQEFLQRHYLEAVRQVAERLRGLSNVVGYDTLNEPLPGYIGWADLGRLPARLLKHGPTPTPLQGMALGAGHAQQVSVFGPGPFSLGRPGQRLLNVEGARAWLPGVDCIWRRHGVWDVGADGRPRLLRPSYFAARDGRPVDFTQDYYYPFARRFAQAVRSVDPGAAIFVQTEVMHPPPRWDAADAAGLVYAPHWYDVFVLFQRRWVPWLAVDTLRMRPMVGARHIDRRFVATLRRFQEDARARLHGAPALLGEFGVPFDFAGGKGFHAHDWGPASAAMDRSMRAVEGALIHATLWNYTADNTNAHGDNWNGEDLSIFSRDQQTAPEDIHAGGRALRAVVRPYARAVAGIPLRMSFDSRRHEFEFHFRHDPAVTAPTEVFVPGYQYPHGCEVEVSDGSYELDRAAQILRYRHTPARPEHTIRIRRKL